MSININFLTLKVLNFSSFGQLFVRSYNLQIPFPTILKEYLG